MKVLFVSSTISQGGAFLFCRELARHMQKKFKDIEIDLVTVHSSEIPVDSLSNTFRNYLEAPSRKEFTTFVNDNKYSLIHWWKSNNDHQFFSYLREFYRVIPIVTTLCQVPVNPRYSLSIWNYLFSSVIVYPCKAAEHHWRIKIFPPHSSLMIYLGTFAKAVVPCPVENRLFSRSDTRLRMIRGSSLGKCPNSAIKLFAEVCQNRHEFIIAGSGATAEKLRLKKCIQSLKLESYIRLVGHLDTEEWIKLLQYSDIYIYVLDRNSFAAIDGTMQDAMLSGLPVVYMGSAGPAELIEHGVSGFIAKNKSQFTKHINELIASRDLRVQIGQNASRRIRECFSFDQTVESYYRAYQCAVCKTPKNLLRNPIAIVVLLILFFVVLIDNTIFILAKKLNLSA